MDIGRDVGLVSGIGYEDCEGLKACGLCSRCARRASQTVARMVIDWRYTRRGRTYPSANEEDRRYTENMTRRMLDILGLPGGAEPLCQGCERKRLGQPERPKGGRCPKCRPDLTGAGGPGTAAQADPGPAVQRTPCGDRSAQYVVMDEAALWIAHQEELDREAGAA